MAFGIMNTRRYALVYSTLGALFLNCCSLYWTMWSVLTMSLFMLTITDFMFFEARPPLPPLPPPSAPRRPTSPPPSRLPPATTAATPRRPETAFTDLDDGWLTDPFSLAGL